MSQRVPRLQIDTAQQRFSIELTSASPVTPVTPARRRPIPSLQISLSPDRPGSSPPASPVHDALRQPKANKALQESRKLLAHLLNALSARTMPPPPEIYTDGRNKGERTMGSVSQSVRVAVKLKASASRADPKASGKAEPDGDDDEEDLVEGGFSTDATYDLMAQLQEVLVISSQNHWQLFEDSELPISQSAQHESFGKLRRPRNSLQPGKRSRSPSPSGQDMWMRGSQVLSQCIDVLASVVSEDCRFKLLHHRPSRPPYALQALVLDFSLFLINSHRHDPNVISRIGFAIIPAFATFPSQMHSRLLVFFENGLIRGMLQDLEHFHGVAEALKFPLALEPDTADVRELPTVSIQVEEPEDGLEPDVPKWKPWISLKGTGPVLLSTNAPLQPLAVYQLGSLIGPLIATILQRINIHSPRDSRLDARHRLYRLLTMVIHTKSDAHLDVLEVVAYNPDRSRLAAVSLLSSFWPRAVGHLTVSKPLPIFNYSEVGLGERAHPYAHEFVPWRFRGRAKLAAQDSRSRTTCRACEKRVEDFGLFCPFCTCAVHFDCYDHIDGEFMMEYPHGEAQKIAVHRSSFVLPPRGDGALSVVHRERHSFRLVNVFTLELCFVCRQPTWGCVRQAYKCGGCSQFAHPSCLSRSSNDLSICGSSVVDSSSITIDWNTLRSSCIERYREIFMPPDQLVRRSYEEIAIMYSILWIQLKLFQSGVEMGSVILNNASNGRPKGGEQFELHYFVQLYEIHLDATRSPSSIAMADYLQENGTIASEHLMMFDWPTLSYIATTVKSPFDAPREEGHAPGMLHVSSADDVFLEDEQEGPQHPYEVTSLAQMRDTLGHGLHVYLDAAATLLLTHLHDLGFYSRVDLQPFLFTEAEEPQLRCASALPLGLDLSNDVETLVAAVDSCLTDLDLSVNEVGFLLLVRRLPVNGMSTEYLSRRLARYVVSWILAEDENLVIILRDYIAKRQSLPGVRSTEETLPWPSPRTHRATPTISINNGGDYVVARRAILHQYGTPWLSRLHEQDPVTYAKLIYELALEIADDAQSMSETALFGELTAEEDKKQRARHCDHVLRCLVKIYNSSAGFTTFDDLLVRWLNSVSEQSLFNELMPSLTRLFQKDVEVSQRYSTLEPVTLEDNAVAPGLDPWRAVLSIAGKSPEGYTRSLQWLRLLAVSGTEIPVAIFRRLEATRFPLCFMDAQLLVQAAFASSWLKSLGRSQLLTLFPNLHGRVSTVVLGRLRSKQNTAEIFMFVRQSLATSLLLYGIERNALVSVGMISESEIENLPSRRKANSRGDASADPVTLDTSLMNVLEEYLDVGNDELSCLIARFLGMFFESPYLESYEVDNIILRNVQALSKFAWQFYDIQMHELSTLRITFLMRVLVVDPLPFHQILQDCFEQDRGWRSRLVAVMRLFRIVLSCIDPAFQVEERQWRTSLTDVFYHYFRSQFADQQEEIRTAVETWSQSLLPRHFEEITLCWNESLSKAPIADRVRLVSFLIQLRAHFGTWQVVSWSCIIDALLETNYERRHGKDDSGPASAHLSMYGISSSDDAAEGDAEMDVLRVSLLLLALQMFADGITTDVLTLLKIKIHVVDVLGFQEVTAAPSPAGSSFCIRFSGLDDVPILAMPCLLALVTVLDASHGCAIAPSAMDGLDPTDDTPCSLLVGSIFVDVFLGIFCSVKDLQSMSVPVLKGVLEGLMIVMYKHDLGSKTLRHLQRPMQDAVKRTMHLLLKADISYELRQLSLSVIQTCLKRWPVLLRQSGLIYLALESAAMISLDPQGQDSLVAQSKYFIESTLTTFAYNGIFSGLCKRPHERRFFVALRHVLDSNAKSAPGESLRDVLLRDTMSRASESERTSLQVILNNLHTYIDVVHHSNYTQELAQFVGQALTALVRRTSEGIGEALDAAPLLLIPSLIIQHNKGVARDLIPYLETVLRVALVRFQLDDHSLSRVLEVTSLLYRKTDTGIGSPNPIVSAVLDILTDGIRGKARIQSSTMSTILQVISMNSNLLTAYHSLAADGFNFLQSYSWTSAEASQDFALSVNVAKMCIEASVRDPLLFEQFSLSPEKHPGLRIRAWNVLLSAALTNEPDSWRHLLVNHFTAFCSTYHAALRIYLQGQSPPDSAIADINHSYISIKLWLLVFQSTSPSGEEVARALRAWNDLWPPFQQLTEGFETDLGQNTIGTLGTLTLTSIADLFVFVHQSHTPLSLERAAHIAILSRLQDLGPNSGKFTRALRTMSDPPGNILVETFVAQIGRELVAAEKLKFLSSRKGEPARGPPIKRVVS